MAKEKDGQEKTEEPTPKKIDDAREQGQTQKSTDLSTALVLLAAFGILAVSANTLLENSNLLFLEIISRIDTFQGTISETEALSMMALQFLGIIMGPFFAGLFVVALIAPAIQEKFKIAKKAMEPKLNKLDPIKGAKKLVSSTALVEFVKGISKMVFIGVAGYFILTAAAGQFMNLIGLPVTALFTAVGTVGAQIMFVGAAILLLLAIPDKIYKSWHFKQENKMTKKEVRDEMKQTEGDPYIKAEIKRLMRQAAVQRMMSSLETADVVITNPTHFAVALKYDEEIGAPQVVAKGARLLAQRIREKATENNIPIVENPPIARALYRQVEIGAVIPKDLYQAVAEVLAFVYALNQKKRRA